jgi:lipoyl(octanoyl) transferase
MAIGVAVSAWIAYYGLAMNIDPAAAHFRLIRPCGIGDRPVTSLARLTGRSHAIEAEMDRLAEAFCTAFPGAELLTEDV